MKRLRDVLRANLRDPFAVMLILSTSIHLGLLLWFGRVANADPVALARQRGRFSINLQATVAAVPDRPEAPQEPPPPQPPPPPPPDPIAEPPPPEPPPPPPPQPRLSAMRKATLKPLKEWLVAAVDPARRLVEAIAELPQVEVRDEPEPPPSPPDPLPPPAAEEPKEEPLPRREPLVEPPRPGASRDAPSSTGSEGAVVDEMPRTITNPAPRYPDDALLAGVQGVVILRVAVGADGSVLRASVYRTSGVASLDEAALEAVLRWQFSPARRGGVAVAKEVAVPVRFAIRGR